MFINSIFSNWHPNQYFRSWYTQNFHAIVLHLVHCCPSCCHSSYSQLSSVSSTNFQFFGPHPTRFQFYRLSLDPVSTQYFITLMQIRNSGYINQQVVMSTGWPLFIFQFQIFVHQFCNSSSGLSTYSHLIILTFVQVKNHRFYICGHQWRKLYIFVLWFNTGLFIQGIMFGSAKQ